MIALASIILPTSGERPPDESWFADPLMASSDAPGTSRIPVARLIW